MVIDGIKAHYNLPGYEPFSVRELIASYGTKWTYDAQQMAAFQAAFVICNDGIIRPRSTVGKWEVLG